MRRSRRRCLPLLLLVTQVTALGADAVSLRRSRDSSDPSDLGWEGKDVYYVPSKRLFCQKCPAGTYVAEECTEQNGSGRCVPCEKGEFMEYPNVFRYCRDCWKCREDQVEVSPCQAVRNTVCACRNGTFCPPDHPCEMCQKCRPRCPEGQVVLKPCTPHSDLQCGPATATSSLYPQILIPVISLAVALLGFLIWRCYCRSPGHVRPSGRRPYEMVRSMFRKLPWYRSVAMGTEDNVTNARLQEQQQQRPAATETEKDSGKPRWNLVPVSEDQHIQALRRSFYTFAEKVPKNSWRRFGRSLDLEENDVVQDYSEDGFYQMLYKWQSREGSKSSVNTLLDTLVQLHQSGVAEAIVKALTGAGLFKFAETS